MKYEQLDLFSDINSSEDKLLFYGSIQDENWKTKTHTVDGVPNIVMDASRELTKNELKSLCRSAVKIIRKTYGFTIHYAESEVNKEIFVRFVNETTKAKIDIFQFIDLYFDSEVEFDKNVKS
ncbi:PcfU [Vagococcus fluvialis]|uniref:hypothetical protein n=1 Tax=Vagococcus fluvialis TaxID=2738 RepID=UPI000A3389C4|nr:hypothetical protein [Vagococcus fluvialis]MBO0419085.1 PcfU [Vagococcus fluvialis]OTP29509.1 hypothetical protein A5798_002677 [Enterococcus sp. 6C8_DIV0013]